LVFAVSYVAEKNTMLLLNMLFAAEKMSLHVVGISAVAKSFAKTYDVAAITKVFTTKIVVALLDMSQ